VACFQRQEKTCTTPETATNCGTPGRLETDVHSSGDSFAPIFAPVSSSAGVKHPDAVRVG
jgi:hypothetical protein